MVRLTVIEECGLKFVETTSTTLMRDSKQDVKDHNGEGAGRPSAQMRAPLASAARHPSRPRDPTAVWKPRDHCKFADRKCDLQAWE